MIGPVHIIHLFRHFFSHKSLCYPFLLPSLRCLGIGNLFVKNLDSSVSDAELQEVFGVFGVISSSKIARDGDEVNKGFGFVQFCSEDSACVFSRPLMDLFFMERY
ncbi:putative RNA recognition motif domain, nucleotide-binding alpha-beta plait domain superfamily [Helianthus anomalus]